MLLRNTFFTKHLRMTALSSFILDLILRLCVPWVNNCRAVEHRNPVCTYSNINQSTKHHVLNSMWYHQELCALMQQQLDRLNSWYSWCWKVVIKHVKKGRNFWFLLVRWATKNSKMNKKSRSSCTEAFCKKEVLKNFEKFTGKHLCWRLF